MTNQVFYGGRGGSKESRVAITMTDKHIICEVFGSSPMSFDAKQFAFTHFELAAESNKHFILIAQSREICGSFASKASNMRKTMNVSYTRSYTNTGVSFRFFDPAVKLN